MARRPTTGLLAQYAKNAGGTSASGYWLKFFSATYGASTSPITMYTQQTGGVGLAKCKLNTRGEPISDSGDDESTFIPYIDGDWDAYIFFTEADADANNTVNSIYLGTNIREVDDLQSNLQFASVATLKTGDALNRDTTVDFADYVGRKVSTVVNNTTSNKGGAEYIIKTEAQRIADGDVIDGDVNHYLLGGTAYVAILDGDLNGYNSGAIGDGSADDTLALQAALDFAGKALNLLNGVFKVSKLVLNAGNVIIGESKRDTVIIGDVVSTRVLEIDNSGGFSNSLNIFCANLNIKATTSGQTTGMRGASDTIYMAYLTILDCLFDQTLEYGCFGNFIQSTFSRCTFGYFGSGSPAMTTAIYLNGQAGVEANNNNINECYVANVSGEGIYISTGWANKIVNTTVEVCGKEALVIDGGLQTTLSGFYVERAWEGNTPAGTEAIIRTANNATTGDTVAAVMIDGGFYQSSAGMSGGFFIDCAGSAIVSIRGAGFGSLGAHPIRLSSNNDKVLFGDDNYYPSGFTGFSDPKIARNSATFYQAFDEQESSNLTNIDDYVKIIKANNGDNISGGASVLGIHAERAASSAFNLIRARVDVDGSPNTVFSVSGNGNLFTSGELKTGGGAWNDGPLILGSYYLWVDGTGDLRINNGAPAGEFGGTVVGTQT